MFKADAEKYLSVKEGVESAQDAAKLARSAGRGGDAAITAATSGAWAVGLLLNRGSLSDALVGFIDLCEEYAIWPRMPPRASRTIWCPRVIRC